jgi:hypothetical protein
MSLTAVYGSDAEDDAAEVISPDKSFKADDTGRAKKKGQARYNGMDKRVLSHIQPAISLEQHAAATVMVETDMSIAKLKAGV